MPIAALAVGASLSGFATHNGAGPGNFTGATTYTARLILDQTQDDPFLNFDPTKQYTAVLTTTVQAFDNTQSPWILNFGIGSLNMYEDTGTPADYLNPGTFTDGTLILSGSVVNHEAYRFNITCNPYTVNGVIVWTGGSRHDELSSGCLSGMVMNDFDSYQTVPCGVSPPAGYQEAYDALWTCPTSTDESTWGGVKALYR
jgi:hypothetical protein